MKEIRNKKYPAIYASMYPTLSEICRENGYALAIHGSLMKDFDLVAVPWVEDAVDQNDLIKALLGEIDGYSVHQVGNATQRPHCRKVWTLMIGGHAYIDIGVMSKGGKE